MGSLIRAQLPADLYQWMLWISEDEGTAYISMNSSGSGGALMPISLEAGLEMKEAIRKLTGEIDGIDIGKDT